MCQKNGTGEALKIMSCAISQQHNNKPNNQTQEWNLSNTATIEPKNRQQFSWRARGTELRRAGELRWGSSGSVAAMGESGSATAATTTKARGGERRRRIKGEQREGK
ncbi:hypothetical protein Droror1_Dr00003232 [Drosera rotundifolia]